MGLLTTGNPLCWDEMKKLSDYIRKHGIDQFINMYRRQKNRTGDIFKFGDETEYIIVKFDHEKKIARLSLRAAEILKILNEMEEKYPEQIMSHWTPEFGAFMLEGTPGKPYEGLTDYFKDVEINLKNRRKVVEELLQENEVLMCCAVFPRLGCPEFTWPIYKPNPSGGASHSLFFPEEAIFQNHSRFTMMARNIRLRKGEKATSNIPIFKDKNTPNPFVEDFSSLDADRESAKAALPDHVYLDGLGSGSGCCSFQLTFQCYCLEEAKYLNDQLIPLGPIMLAITAASPIHRGYLTETDSRWSVIADLADCRTREERGLEPLNNNKFVIPEKRFGSVPCYLSSDNIKYNDTPIIYDEAIYEKLKNNDVDHSIAQHVAHLFIRDVIVLFEEQVHQNDEIDTDHFESIQSTNWNTMRFKPPPPNSNIGWRLEFRPCELQCTDFENAAVACFLALLTRAILSYRLDFVIPLSKVNENLKNAQKRNALNTEKFWFRKYRSDESKSAYVLMTINEIINGKEGEFPGLIPLLNTYLFDLEIDADTDCQIRKYMNLIRSRASGELMTTASWIRKFVREHPAYKFDSVISDEINYDLLWRMYKIQSGAENCTELFGKLFDTRIQIVNNGLNS